MVKLLTLNMTGTFTALVLTKTNMPTVLTHTDTKHQLLLPLLPLLQLLFLNQLITTMKNPDTLGKFTAPLLKEELNMLTAKTQNHLLFKSSMVKLLTLNIAGTSIASDNTLNQRSMLTVLIHTDMYHQLLLPLLLLQLINQLSKLISQLPQLIMMMKNPDTLGKFTAPLLKVELNMLTAKTQSQLHFKTSMV
jgi:hypothetical protein